MNHSVKAEREGRPQMNGFAPGGRARILLALAGASTVALAGIVLVVDHPAPPVSVAAHPGRAEEADGSAAYAIAQRIGCADYEPQSHLPTVQSQGTCRLGGVRIYVQTFAKSGARTTYVQGGSPAGHVTGTDLGASTWVVHMDSSSAAPAVRSALAGMRR
jgi:hypothetical protein